MSEAISYAVFNNLSIIKNDTGKVFIAALHNELCNQISKIDSQVSSSDTIKGIVFKGNKNLQSIDISSLYTDKMNSYKEMFLELPKNGIITFNMNTHFMILEQIPEEWEKIGLEMLRSYGIHVDTKHSMYKYSKEIQR